MKRMILDIEKTQKLSAIDRKLANLKKKRAATGRRMKSSLILGHPSNSFLTAAGDFKVVKLGG